MWHLWGPGHKVSQRSGECQTQKQKPVILWAKLVYLWIGEICNLGHASYGET